MDNFDYKNYLKNNPLLTESEEKEVDEVMGIDRTGNKKPESDISNLSKAKEVIRNMKKDDVKESTTPKMKVSELKAKIKEDILSMLSEADEDVNVDVEDGGEDVNVDVEGDNIDIEKKGVDAKIKVGLSPEEEIVQDSLQAAMDAANSLGNQKLADQIGNTITFFTREYIVGRNSD